MFDLFALEVPQLTDRVNDYANMLTSHTKRQLDAMLHQLEQTDSTQITVLTISSLEGEVIEEFSIRVVEQWKIGQKGQDNGALLLISKSDRKIRIEVGYGLEGTLTDLLSGRIIRDVIVPWFKRGDIDRGVLEGVQAMIGVVKGEFTADNKALKSSGRKQGSHTGIFSLIVFLFLINMLGRLRRPAGAVAGGFLFPIIGGLFFSPGLLIVLALIPLGIVSGLLLSFFGSPLSFSHMYTSRHTGGGWHSRGFGGGSWSGGFGGFSGGGGGFGGGGASGGW